MKKKKKRTKQKRLSLSWFILLSVIGLLIYLYIGGDYGLYQHWKLKKQKRILLQEFQQLKKEQDSLQVVIQQLKTDSSYMAKIAREKYNMGRPDEEIIRVITKKEYP
ncbi:MAG: septum formation initiator family protein [Calditrichaeota bacterium]|nr:MAG: septum formation initiator family protein [Calditrichota bacterium]